MKSRHDELLTLLEHGQGGDPAALAKELSSLSAISSLCDRAFELGSDRASLSELLSASDDDEELAREIRGELEEADARLRSLSRRLLRSLVPTLNPEEVRESTSSDAVIDIRAGTGGDEAALFAAELMAGYEAIARTGGVGDDECGGGGKAWDVEILSVSRTDLGGVKEASLAVSSRGGGGGGDYGGGYGALDSFGDSPSSEEEIVHNLLQQLGPYGFFRFESGVHRVQRVPINDNKLQTSAVSVAILPSLPADRVAEALPPAELKIETMRASGAGGQNVNTTESAVRVTHIPTGIVAYIQEERSQHKNKTKALKLVAARVYAQKREQEAKNRSAVRSSLMGGGDRSERIRTYNCPQDRITDHRCKVSVQGVQAWLGGGGMVRKFGPHLYEMDWEERVAALEEEEQENERRRKADDGAGKGKAVKGKGRKK